MELGGLEDRAQHSSHETDHLGAVTVARQLPDLHGGGGKQLAHDHGGGCVDHLRLLAREAPESPPRPLHLAAAEPRRPPPPLAPAPSWVGNTASCYCYDLSCGGR